MEGYINSKKLVNYDHNKYILIYFLQINKLILIKKLSKRIYKREDTNITLIEIKYTLIERNYLIFYLKELMLNVLNNKNNLFKK